MNIQFISGFSKLSKLEKIKTISSQFPEISNLNHILSKFLSSDEEINSLIDHFSENVITNYHLPFSIAPNFLINNKIYHIPMVIEESSVVAAASWSAKFWQQHGGFKAKVSSMYKSGQVHFTWKGNPEKLIETWQQIKSGIIDSLTPFLSNMHERGGGLISMDLLDKTDSLKNYYKIDLTLDTRDSMGANLINTCLEEISRQLTIKISKIDNFSTTEKDIQIIMSILSNYTPECLVECEVECDISAFEKIDNTLTAKQFIDKFELAVNIANKEVNRAVTHNKGIFNGIDAVLLATGNDFRATESGGHAYASKNGRYRGLTEIDVCKNMFKYKLTVPLAVGTVGGVTSLHPLAKLSLQLLGSPNAEDLMKIIASAGMANNFSAIKSLVTKGIQHGHMKMHLQNILLSMHATNDEKAQLINIFKDKIVSHHEVKNYLNYLRTK